MPWITCKWFKGSRIETRLGYLGCCGFEKAWICQSDDAVDVKQIGYALLNDGGGHNSFTPIGALNFQGGLDDVKDAIDDQADAAAALGINDNLHRVCVIVAAIGSEHAG